MGSPASEVIEGWVQLGEWWLSTWGPHAAAVSSKAASASYRAADRDADLRRTLKLAVETASLVMNEVLDSMAILRGNGQPGTTSEPFELPVEPETAPPGARRLALAGPLVSGFGDQLPVAAVTIDPNPVVGDERTFCLHVDDTGCNAGYYEGNVNVSTRAGVVVGDPIHVDIQIP